jgi:hypothetical protein
MISLYDWIVLAIAVIAILKIGELGARNRTRI